MGSRGLLDGEQEGEQFETVIVPVMFEEAEDGVQEFAHDGHQGLQFGFAL